MAAPTADDVIAAAKVVIDAAKTAGDITGIDGPYRDRRPPAGNGAGAATATTPYVIAVFGGASRNERTCGNEYWSVRLNFTGYGTSAKLAAAAAGAFAEALEDAVPVMGLNQGSILEVSRVSEFDRNADSTLQAYSILLVLVWCKPRIA